MTSSPLCGPNSLKLLLLFALLSFMNSAYALEFSVGGENGWIVPSSKNAAMYNQWASRNRFQVGDVVSFHYKKDSVMVVTEEEYEKCKSARPIFFSNNGNTQFKLDNSGMFYFISGVTGHCERGQKMIIKVMSHSVAPGTSPPSPDSPDSSAVAIPALAHLQAIAMLVGYLFV